MSSPTTASGLSLPRRRIPAAPAPMTWTYDVAPADPVISRDVVAPETCEQLIECWHSATEQGLQLDPLFGTQVVEPAQVVVPPEETHNFLRTLLQRAAHSFRVPYDPRQTQFGLCRYGVGAGTGWHTDTHPEAEGGLERRTVSLSILLNSDFTGGDLVTDPGGIAEMTPGSVCAFTALTMHRVCEVTSGERFALIAFGAFGGVDRCF